jgi:hypothetical protein
MSCSILLARVDWVQLCTEVDLHPDPEEFLDLYGFDAPDWWVSTGISEEGSEYFASHKYASILMRDVYENIRSTLSDEQRKVTDPIVNLVACGYYNPESEYYQRRKETISGDTAEYYALPFDLGEQHRRFQHETSFVAVLSPETVHHYLLLWDKLPYGDLREGFEALRARGLENPDWRFIEEWFDGWPRLRGYFDAFRYQLELCRADGFGFVLQVWC